MRTIPSSELIINADGSIFHLHLKPEQLADIVILVGDPGRVAMIAEYFEEKECEVANREFLTVTGTYKGKRMTVMSTGIGIGNIDICVTELDALANIDFETRQVKPEFRQLTLVRLGTSGAIQRDIEVGEVVFARTSLGFDGLLSYYAGRDSVCDLALEKAFELYPDIKTVVVAHLYGTPAKVDEIKRMCDAHGAIIIEDAAESLGATYKGMQTGRFGDFSAISFNGNKIITGSSGGMLLTDSYDAACKVRKWSTQSRENAPWYQHEELGYNYRMSNVIAGVVRGQLPYLEEHIAQKKAIYMRYKTGLADLPITMNTYDEENSEPNFWLSCMMIDEDVMCKQVRGEQEALYVTEKGKTCPTEILETLAKYNAEGRPIWKPMHMQPIYRMNPFITREGNGRARTNAYIAGGARGTDGKPLDVGMDIFNRGLCLPSDNKMTPQQQDAVIEIIRSCFDV